MQSLDNILANNMRDLKVPLGLASKIGKRAKRYLGILSKGFISKQEVINLRGIFSGCKRNKLTETEMNELHDAFLYPLTEKVKISEDHTAQGLNWLKSLYLTPTGNRKRNSKLGELVNGSGYYVDSDLAEHVLTYFSHFEFAGFIENCNSYRSEYKAIWKTIAKDGKFFKYTQEYSGFWKR